MKILQFAVYRDGGSIELTTDKGIFCFDYRLSTKTKGMLYEGYPKDDNSNIIEDSQELENELIESLKNYKDEFYKSTIEQFIDSRQK